MKPRAATNFADKAEYEYFACHVADPELHYAIRVELERRKMETRTRRGRQTQ